MKILQRDTEALVEMVNGRIEEILDSLRDQYDTIIAGLREDGATIEALPRDEDDLGLFCFPLNGVDFAAAHAVVQIGAIRPGVIALADHADGPLVLVVDDGDGVDHDPRLRKVLEDSAADFMRSVGLGVFWVAVNREGHMPTLTVINNPHHENGDPVRVGDGSVFKHGDDMAWSPEHRFTANTPHYVRAAGAPDYITIGA